MSKEINNNRNFFVDTMYIDGRKVHCIAYYEKGKLKKIDDIIFSAYPIAAKHIDIYKNELNDKLNAPLIRELQRKEKKSESKEKDKSTEEISLIERISNPQEDTVNEGTEVEEDTVVVETTETEDETDTKGKEVAEEETEDKDDKKDNKNSWKKFIAGFLAAVVTLVGGHFIGVGISSLGNKDEEGSSVSDTSDEDEELNNSKDDVVSSIESIKTQDEALSEEAFTNLVAEYSLPYTKNELPVSTEEITKFVAIVNIDKLVEENQEFASELFSVQTSEEFVNDAGKVLGATTMYNYKQYLKDGNTSNFIKISDAVVGEQKDAMLKIEEYTEKIAILAKKSVVDDNFDEANALVSEFIDELNYGSLSKLDDGVGFATQLNLSLISDVIMSGELSKANYDKLQILKKSKKHVSDIYTVYDRCITDSKSKTLTK